MKSKHTLEDGRIGEHPEVIYHVFHTLLFGALALLFDGYVYYHELAFNFCNIFASIDGTHCIALYYPCYWGFVFCFFWAVLLLPTLHPRTFM